MAGAQAPAGGRGALAGSSVFDAPSWWGEVGRPGWLPDGDWGLTMPRAIAGHAVGGWSLEDEEAPSRPFPGVAQAQSPLAAYDSIGFASGRGAWDGFRASLFTAELRRHPLVTTGGRGGRSVGDLVLGSGSGHDKNALWLRRGDSLFQAQLGAQSWRREATDPYGPAGHHLYGGSASVRRGDWMAFGRFAQRGAAASLLAGQEQAVSGVAGSGGVGFQAGSRTLTLAAGRALDDRESFGGLLLASRREADENWAELELGGDSVWAARLVWSDAEVTRRTEGFAERWTTTQTWLAVRAQARRGRAVLDGALGAGRNAAVGGTTVAPSLGVGFVEGGFRARLFLERVAVPVWSDLAIAQPAFLQSTWLGGFEVGAERRAAGGQVGWRMGRTRQRALVRRLPFEDLWLREGLRAQPESYTFGLATMGGQLRGTRWATGAEMFLLLRDGTASQPQVDPAKGGRAYAEFGVRAFQGDLGVRLRGEVDAVGGRQSDTFLRSWLPGYAVFGVSAILDLADATVSLRLRNLEDEPHVLPWIDDRTGLEALSPGREFRLTLVWRLFD